MSPADRHKSGEYHQGPVDAAFILVMRDELNAALKPLQKDVGDIKSSLADGKTTFALHDIRLASLEDNKATTTALVRKKPSLWDKFGIAILIGAATAIGSVAGPGIIAVFNHGAKP